eukprot:TRINITY_DN18527_c0_g1_i1.p1 TRINITY_DN18527_c0_g1~~TRINITY_DN18527_c0_g1_i1.p1  ORF type:complete len:483 (-),score=63.70 TRINITY_DN18527_c0_g1_i1:62-1453(-)
MVQLFLTTESWDAVRKVRRQLEAQEIANPGSIDVDRDGKIFLETSLSAISERLMGTGLIERVFLCLHKEPLAEDHPVCRDGPNYQVLKSWLRSVDWRAALQTVDELHRDQGAPRGPRAWTVFSKRQGAKGSLIREFDRLDMQQHAREVLHECLEPLSCWHDSKAPEFMVYVFLTSALALVAIPVLQRRVKQGYFPHKGLHHSLCWGMARTAKLLPGELVVDPMAGRGVVVLEAAVYWPDCQYLMSEANTEQLAKAWENLHYAASRGVFLHGTSPLTLLRADCRCLPIQDGYVDVVLSDLPWGRQFGTEESNVALYSALLREVSRVLRPGRGRAVLITSATSRNMDSISSALVGTELLLVKALRFRFGGNHDRVRCIMYCLQRSEQGSFAAPVTEDLFDWSCFGDAARDGDMDKPLQETLSELDKDAEAEFVWKGVKPLLHLYRPAREGGAPREVVVQGSGYGP